MLHEPWPGPSSPRSLPPRCSIGRQSQCQQQPIGNDLPPTILSTLRLSLFLHGGALPHWCALRWCTGDLQQWLHGDPILERRCRSPRQLARHIQNRMARSLVGSTARTCLWKNSVSHPIGPSCRNLSKHCGGHRGRCCTSPKNPDRRDGIRATILVVAEGARPETQPPDEFEAGGVPRLTFREVPLRHHLRTGTGLSSVPRLDPAQVLLCEFAHTPSHQCSTPFVSCRPPPGSPVAPHPFRPAVAGVAAPLTSLAITVQLALGEVFCCAGGLHQRALLQGFAGRLEVGSPPTLSCGTWTSRYLSTDNRRLEVVVDGLPLFGGSQLAIDTTLVCAMHCDGSPHLGCSRDGAQAEGAMLPRIGGTSQQSSIGGARGGSWEQVVS